jgi:hypothetical protein
MARSSVPGRAIRAGSFGLIQQFGVGVDNIDLDAAADGGGSPTSPGTGGVSFKGGGIGLSIDGYHIANPPGLLAGSGAGNGA